MTTLLYVSTNSSDCQSSTGDWKKKLRFWHKTKNVAIIEDIIADCNENTLCQLVDCILIIGIIFNQDDQIKNVSKQAVNKCRIDDLNLTCSNVSLQGQAVLLPLQVIIIGEKKKKILVQIQVYSF